MEKIKKIGIVLFLFCFIFGGIGCSSTTKKEESSDGIQFKEEYEKLNGTIRESDGALYNTVSIEKENPIKYIDAKEATQIIKNKTGVIYFGASWCPWCRNAIPVLFDVAKKKKIDTIYYVDMDQVRNIYEIKDGSLVKVQEEKEGYYELLEALDSILGENTYTLTSDGQTYDTKEKRIYMPLVVGIKEGSIVDSHVGTVSLNEDQTKYSPLTKEQYDELYKQYESLFSNIYNSCTDNKC
jgi:thiol-disulfide isomerase/thioredoxin